MPESINLTDVHFYVTCPVCETSFGISVSKPHMERVCRCLKGSFIIAVSAGPGKKRPKIFIKVKFRHNNTSEEDVEAKDITTGQEG